MSSMTEDPAIAEVDPPLVRGGPLGRAWDTYVTQVRLDANAASLEAIGTSDRRASDSTVITVAVVAAVCLTGINYFGKTFEPHWFQSLLRSIGLDGAANQVGESILHSARGKFWGLVFWTAARTVFYIGLPLVACRALLGLRPSDLGVRMRGSFRHATPYVVLLIGAAPIIVWASFGPEFGARYPFYKPLPGEGLWPYLVAWWVIYGIQFVGVEIFFRGFLVLGLAPRMGITAVFVSMIPYVMIHFDKPLPESFGAILAGTALGFLALKYRSIWWGAALHIAVAVSFDLLALQHQGFFS